MTTPSLYPIFVIKAQSRYITLFPGKILDLLLPYQIIRYIHIHYTEGQCTSTGWKFEFQAAEIFSSFLGCCGL